MPLIKCPECSNWVSDKATGCPKCGYPLDAPAPQRPADLDALIKQTLSREGYVERLDPNSATVAARSRPADGVGKFIGWIGWLVALTISVGLGIMLAKCSPDSDPDYKAGRDFAFHLRSAEKYSFGTNQSLSEGDRDDTARSYVPKTLSAERQEKWKEGFKSGLGL